MASSKLLVIVLAAIALLSTTTMATDHVVGGETGWKLNVNYTDWAATTTFNVGDKLVFNYNNTAHNVLRVDGASFKNCSKPLTAPHWNSGKDTVALTEQGRQWYICGVADHCLKGMKFVITVQGGLGLGSPPTALPGAATGSPAPAPAPTSTAAIVAAPMFFGSLVALLGVALF